MTEPLLDIDRARVLVGRVPDRFAAVEDVTLRIDAGEVTALVGESGCGKSTLARAIMGLNTLAAGAIRFRGTPMLPLSRRSKAQCRQLQMIFQDPDASLNPRLTLQTSIAEPLLLHERLSRAEREKRVLELFDAVGLDRSLRLRYPHELSGGQRQRVCIARALATRPDVIICDEAVSALDVSIQAQILNLLMDLKRRFGLAYLFITHDLGVVRQIADSIAVMYLGELVEVRSADALFSDPRHPYTQALLAAVPTVDQVGKRPAVRALGEVPNPASPPSGCRFHPRCPRAFEPCARLRPALYPVEQGESRCFLDEPSA